jgi:ABC-2 type transport system ATP-binding protein
VLVLDEPGNGLDPQGIRALRDLLRSRADAGHTVFLSSHLLAEVEHLADEVIVLNQGRLVTSGPLRDLQTAATRVRCGQSNVLAEALWTVGALVEQRDTELLIVRGVATDVIGDVALAAGVALHELTADTSSLEELFLGWTGQGASMSADLNTEEVAS